MIIIDDETHMLHAIKALKLTIGFNWKYVNIMLRSIFIAVE